MPYCPVRPQEFGFYGTQWRRWPGQGVVPVSDERAVTPVVPPRLAVPDPDQESMRSPEEDADLANPDSEPAEDAAPADPLKPVPELPLEPAPQPPFAPPSAPSPVEPAPREPEPAPEPKPTTPAAKPETEPEMPELDFKSPAPQKPDLPKPGVPPQPEDENLFEARPRDSIRRRFLVGQAKADGSDGAGVRPAAHGRAADPRDVPPVPFDPAVEGRRLRSGR